MLHLIKLCVGVNSPTELVRWQMERAASRRAQGLDPRPRHRTRSMPRRKDELLEGGSLYWVIRHEVRLRQRIAAIERDETADGSSCALLIFDFDLVPTEPVPRRPFQGWRYLKPDDAPPDLASVPENQDVAPELRLALERLGLRRWSGREAAT